LPRSPRSSRRPRWAPQPGAGARARVCAPRLRARLLHPARRRSIAFPLQFDPPVNKLPSPAPSPLPYPKYRHAPPSQRSPRAPRASRSAPTSRPRAPRPRRRSVRPRQPRRRPRRRRPSEPGGGFGPRRWVWPCLMHAAQCRPHPPFSPLPPSPNTGWQRPWRRPSGGSRAPKRRRTRPRWHRRSCAARATPSARRRALRWGAPGVGGACGAPLPDRGILTSMVGGLSRGHWPEHC
jgi:hypothetical protein